MGRNEKRRQEAGAAPTRFSSLQEPRGFGPAGCCDPTGIPRLWARASGRAPDPSAGSALGGGGGEGATPQPVPAGGGGSYCEEGRRAHLKFRDICSSREETLGARRLGAPTPPALPAIPGAGLPHSPCPYPQPPTLACRRGCQARD